MLRSVPALFCFVVCLMALPSCADHASDEAAIRALIAQLDQNKAVARTSDRVFWSGAYEKPVIGDERPVARKGEGGVENRVPGSQRAQTTIRKIVISDAGDMAYDYSDATLTFDMKNGTKFSLKNSGIRVWRKEGGQWKLAVQFTAPHNDN
jgi:ketosteroid isomerase-like protein